MMCGKGCEYPVEAKGLIFARKKQTDGEDVALRKYRKLLGSQFSGTDEELKELIERLFIISNVVIDISQNDNFKIFLENID